MRTYTPLVGYRLPRLDLAGARRLEQVVDRSLRRRDRPETELGVEVRARRVEDPDDDALVVETLHRHLRDHDVRVVAVGRDDDGVRVLDTGLAQDVDVHPVAEHEAAAPVLAEPRQGLFLLVDGGYLPALVGELNRHLRPHPAAADHQRSHELRIPLQVRIPVPLLPRGRLVGTPRRAPPPAPSGARIRPSARRSATGAAN